MSDKFKEQVAILIDMSPDSSEEDVLAKLTRIVERINLIYEQLHKRGLSNE